jgi:hypothetical protein
MGDKLVADIATIATGIIGLTIIAVLVSKQAKTGSVITSAGNAFAADLKAAVSPLGTAS